jgi:hypothetical protein
VCIIPNHLLKEECGRKSAFAGLRLHSPYGLRLAIAYGIARSEAPAAR